jgi:hypothetical protein
MVVQELLVYKDQQVIRALLVLLGHKVFLENMQALVQQVPVVSLVSMDPLVQQVLPVPLVLVLLDHAVPLVLQV